MKNRPGWTNEAYIERVAEAIQLIWAIRNNRIFNKRKTTKKMAIRMLNDALKTKKETE